MIKNYFKIAWRNITRGKSFSIINISGLAIGMAGAALILLWMQNEISFDKFHENKDNLYEVYGLTNNVGGEAQTINQTEQPLAPTLVKNYPEVENAAREAGVNSFLITAGDKSFTGIQGSFVDPSFLQMFSFPLNEGGKNEQLKSIYSITITEKLAGKLFGKEDALGKIIKIDSVDNFTVTGVLKDLPSNTRFDFEYLLPWEYLKKLGWNNDSWLSNSISTFVLLKPGTEITVFNDKIRDIAKRTTGQKDIWTHFLFPLRQWHLYAEFENGIPVSGQIKAVRVLGIIATFILLIACINFMNLSTARSEKRSKEVGIRKVAGAGKNLLIGQFIAEAFLMACVAGVFSLLIVQLVLPAFNSLINKQLFIQYNNVYFWVYALGFIVLTGLLAGSYPAFYLSSFKPISIFKKQFKKYHAIVSPRKVLVVLQFTFAVILIVSTIAIRNQVQYVQDRKTGYSKNNLIYVRLKGDIKKNYQLIRQELINSGVAISVTKTLTSITRGGDHTWGLRWPGENPKDTSKTITLFGADADLVKTAGFQLIDGRDIDIYKYPTDSFAVLLNQTAVKLMGFQNPVGQVISNPFSKVSWHVVGVVKDYITGSAYNEISPTMIMGPGGWFNTMHIKFNSAHSTANNLEKAAGIFKKYNPAYPFNYQFVDQEYAMQFDDEQRTKMMAGLFAALAIFISCLGLFGLSITVAESRIKEIGVRKVLGASVAAITTMLSKDFVKLVLIAIVIASPIAWWLMDKWLQDFAYRINVNVWIFVLAGVIALLIALITVSFQAIRAAIANPVKSLRTE